MGLGNPWGLRRPGRGPACGSLSGTLRRDGFAADWLIQIGAYGHPDRDSRGRTISIVYGTRWYGSGDTVPEVEAADDAADARWFPVTALPDEIAFAHRRVLNDAMARLDEGELVERLVWRLETTHGAVLRPRGITPY